MRLEEEIVKKFVEKGWRVVAVRARMPFCEYEQQQSVTCIDSDRRYAAIPPKPAYGSPLPVAKVADGGIFLSTFYATSGRRIILNTQTMLLGDLQTVSYQEFSDLIDKVQPAGQAPCFK